MDWERKFEEQMKKAQEQWEAKNRAGKGKQGEEVAQWEQGLPNDYAQAMEWNEENNQIEINWNNLAAQVKFERRAFAEKVQQSPEYQMLLNGFNEYRDATIEYMTTNNMALDYLESEKDFLEKTKKFGGASSNNRAMLDFKKETDELKAKIQSRQQVRQDYAHLYECIDYMTGGKNPLSPKAKEYWDKFMEEHAKTNPETGGKIYPFGLETKDMEAMRAPIVEQQELEEKKARETEQQLQESRERTARERVHMERTYARIDSEDKKWEKITAAERVPGNIQFFMDYPGVDPQDKWEKGDYKRYVETKKGELSDVLFEEKERPKKIDIAFDNLDHIILNLKSAALKDKKLDTDELHDKLQQTLLNQSQTNKVLKKYMVGTMETFMDVAYKNFEEKKSKVSREHLILVDGISVSSHLKRMGYQKDDKTYDEMVSIFVGTALQNGDRVEAYIPDKNGQLPAERVQLNAVGSKVSEMKLLKEGAWDKFCNFFGYTTERQRHNAVVRNYFKNIENNRKWLESKLKDDMLGVKEAREKDQQTRTEIERELGNEPNVDNAIVEPEQDEPDMNEAFVEPELDEDEGVSWSR